MICITLFEILLLHLLGINVHGHFLTPAFWVTNLVVMKFHERNVIAPRGSEGQAYHQHCFLVSFYFVDADTLQCTESFLLLYGLST